MSNYSQFFPTAGSGGGGGVSTPGNRLNRRIFYGPIDSPTAATLNWTVPDTTTSVQVHVWGGGGGGFCAPTPDTVHCYGGGGGGGYARAEYIVTGGDTLALTIGGISGTSSVTIPTQSPTSPLSASSGGTSVNSTGANGGSGSISLNPTFPTGYCFTATGGTGGCGNCQASPNPWPGTSSWWQLKMGGGGGSAGSPRGNGCPGGDASQPNWTAGGGGGIGGRGQNWHGGGARGHASQYEGGVGGMSNSNRQSFGSSICGRRQQATRANCNEDLWWNVEDIQGAGGLGAGCSNAQCQNNLIMAGGKGAGGGGGWIKIGCAGSMWNYYTSSQGARGGILGGGGGNILYCNVCPTQPTTYNPVGCGVPTAYPGTCVKCWCCDGKGGAAGGSGGGQTGTPGVVIIYW